MKTIELLNVPRGGVNFVHELNSFLDKPFSIS